MTRVEKLLLFLALTNAQLGVMLLLRQENFTNREDTIAFEKARSMLFEMQGRVAKSLGLDLKVGIRFDTVYALALDVLEQLIDVEGSTSDNP